jgi:hypothetical protein
MLTNQSHHGSAHDNITVLVVLAVVMAPGLPIYRSTFSAGGDIGPVFPPNLHVMAGNRGGVLLLLVPLEALLWRQFSWMKASLLFVFHFSVLFQLIVRCIVLLLHRLPRFFLVSPSIPFFRFHLALPYEIVGGCWYYRRYPKYSRPLFSNHPSSS